MSVNVSKSHSHMSADLVRACPTAVSIQALRQRAVRVKSDVSTQLVCGLPIRMGQGTTAGALICARTHATRALSAPCHRTIVNLCVCYTGPSPSVCTGRMWLVSAGFSLQCWLHPYMMFTTCGVYHMKKPGLACALSSAPASLPMRTASASVNSPTLDVLNTSLPSVVATNPLKWSLPSEPLCA